MSMMQLNFTFQILKFKKFKTYGKLEEHVFKKFIDQNKIIIGITEYPGDK